MKALLPLFLATAGLLAQEPLPIQGVRARLMKILVHNSSDPGRIACRDSALGAEFMKAGLKVDPAAKVAWATSEEDIRAFATEGKLVATDRASGLREGASVGLVHEKGRLAVYLHLNHVYKAKVRLNPAVYDLLGANLP